MLQLLLVSQKVVRSGFNLHLKSPPIYELEDDQDLTWSLNELRLPLVLVLDDTAFFFVFRFSLCLSPAISQSLLFGLLSTLTYKPGNEGNVFALHQGNKDCYGCDCRSRPRLFGAIQCCRRAHFLGRLSFPRYQVQFSHCEKTAALKLFFRVSSTRGCSSLLQTQMSMFLNDVLETYRIQGLVPRLSVARVEAKLWKVGVRLGGISKNT